MKKTDEYYQSLEVCNNPQDYHNMELMVAKTYIRSYDEAILIQERELLIDFCLKVDEKLEEYGYLAPNEEFINKYIKGN